jgi:hypothetical protein
MLAAVANEDVCLLSIRIRHEVLVFELPDPAAAANVFRLRKNDRCRGTSTSSATPILSELLT